MARRALVISSRNDAHGVLSFLPERGQELYRVLTDDKYGAALPALDGPGGGLLINPTASDADRTIRKAFQSAAQRGDTLILAFIGHGILYGPLYYLVTQDTPHQAPLNSRNALNLIQLILEEALADTPSGLIVLVDACAAGEAAASAAGDWGKSLHGRLHYALYAGTDHRPAYDGCFTRILIETLRNGIDFMHGRFVLPAHFTSLVHKCCGQKPQYSAAGVSTDGSLLWVGYNRTCDSFVTRVAETVLADRILAVTRHYQPPPQLRALVEASDLHPCLGVIGKSGTGKSALCAALATPEISGGMVPDGFCSALLFLDRQMTLERMAEILTAQLEKCLPDFQQARQKFEHTPCLSLAESNALTPLQHCISRPLALLGHRPQPVRLVLDGLDQVKKGYIRNELHTFLEECRGMAQVRLILTARERDAFPPDTVAHAIEAPHEDLLRRYFTARGIAQDRAETLLGSAASNWLLARMLAVLDEIAAAAPASAAGRARREECYAEWLQNRIGPPAGPQWQGHFRPVLAALALFASGRDVPLSFLLRICRALNGPASLSALREVLAELAGPVMCLNPGMDCEQVGLFHTTFADYLLDPGSVYAIEARGEYARLARYYQNTLEDHRGEDRRLSSEGLDQATTVAEYLARAGQTDAALKLYAELEACRPDHADTMNVLSTIAFWTDTLVSHDQARGLYERLLAAQQRVFGTDHPATVQTCELLTGWSARREQSTRFARDETVNSLERPADAPRSGVAGQTPDAVGV
jgi:hypothetical protein